MNTDNFNEISRRAFLGAGAALGLDTFLPNAYAQEKKGFQGPWKIPVVVVKYFPVKADGETIDIKVTSNVGGTLDNLRRKVSRTQSKHLEALEEGSRFRAYKNEDAPKSLDYEIIKEFEYLEAMPKSEKKFGKSWLPDYNSIMERINIRDWVEKQGVKEVWLWGYHSPTLAPWESNMSSPFGDISNSDRDPKDLPVLNKTYTVYHYNYQRGPSEATENHMHQIEAIMRRLGGKLWRTFEGTKGNWRCGNCHFPPNGKSDYDWANKTPVMSDIEDWKPEGFGKKIPINCDKWDGQSLKWFIYWMRSIPGMNNGLTYQGKNLTNWWHLIGDYDNARRQNVGLVER